ncbi:pirin-like protein [Neltuma alba]|uniref:pirin-like protein n=1 Tax=Neltuma alba TaxID=207710 RepID=UPI0010A31CDF|nr:pirin-like protein [Prosopis alba]
MRAIRNILGFNWSDSFNSTSGLRSINSRKTFSFVRNIMSQSDESPAFSKPRLVLKKVFARNVNEGSRLMVNRTIASEFKGLDPFLNMDHFSVTYPGGFTDHPHRGFETVTYMLEGALVHQDFAGNKGTIRAGDVQWMSAGRGIIHSEMPAGVGTHTGVQLWINLSKKDKMIEPKYQDLLKENIPRAEKDGVEVKVIAGEALGVQSEVYTRTPAMFLDFKLNPQTQMHQNIPETWNSFAYVLEGEGVFGSPSSSPIGPCNVVFLGPGDGVSVWNKSSEPLRFLLIGGEPLKEPVAQYGPFVMNAHSEIEKAMEDFQYCKNGFENGRHWRSS